MIGRLRMVTYRNSETREAERTIAVNRMTISVLSYSFALDFVL